MLKKIAISIAILVAGVLLFAATRPDTFQIQRAASIKAPPEKIYALLEDFDRAPEWSPYEKKDPNMKRARSGPSKGKGAIYAFDGNNEVGTGRLEVLEVSPPSRIVIRLDMRKPFEASHTIEYTLVPQGDATKVIWAMRGDMPYLSKVICLFVDMDKMVGKDFEAGLASLKAVTEKS